jgi:acetoin:2,6-dichlorophenolindophenol oxidoreductase subunit alpha
VQAERGISSPEGLKWMLYRKMLQIRRVEESLLQLFTRGILFGTVHTCIGQEPCGVGVTQALEPATDVVWSNHRGHGHYLAFTGDLQGLISEILGKASGACGGIGGSQHLHNRNIYTNGILGGTLPCAAGCAFAEKFKKTGGIVTVFFGDGALGEGVIYETFNVASLWGLPILFVLEDNGYAQSTPRAFEHAGEISRRAESFNIPITRLEADHVVSVWQTASRIVKEIRRNQQPQLLALQTYRLAPHSKGDDNRDPQELEAHWAADPLKRHRQELAAEDAPRLEQLEQEVSEEIQRCIDFAISDKPMETAHFLKYVDQDDLPRKSE